MPAGEGATLYLEHDATPLLARIDRPCTTGTVNDAPPLYWPRLI
jgi:hypothetical protein